MSRAKTNAKVVEHIVASYGNYDTIDNPESAETQVAKLPEFSLKPKHRQST